jgi:hypothetical protein
MSYADLMEIIELEDSWKENASCKHRQNLFFTRGPIALFKARRICFECPVYDQCLSWILENFSEVEDGIFAGYDEKQRFAMARRGAPVIDWRVTFSPEKRCDHHAEEKITHVSKNRKGEEYFICLDCGARLKRLAS